MTTTRIFFTTDLHLINSDPCITFVVLLTLFENRLSREFNKILVNITERFNNLKTRVIDPALKEVNKYTDIVVTYKNIKKGRNIVALEFFIETNQQTAIKFE